MRKNGRKVVKVVEKCGGNDEKSKSGLSITREMEGCGVVSSVALCNQCRGCGSGDCELGMCEGSGVVVMVKWNGV